MKSDTLKNFFYMVSYSWKEAKRIYFFAVFKIILDSVSPFITLWFPKLILDELSLGKDLRKAITYVLLMLAVQTGISVIYKLWTYLYVVFTADILFDMEVHFKKMYSDMDYADLEDGAVDEKIWFVREGFNVEGFILEKLGGFITAILQLAGYVYIISSLHPIVSVLLLAVLGFRTLLSHYRNEWNIEYSKRTTVYDRKFSYFFSLLTGRDFAQDIRLHGAVGYLRNKYKKVADEYMKAYASNQKKGLFFSIPSDVIEMIQTVIMYGYSAYKVALGDITVGGFTVYIGSVTGFLSSVSGLVGVIQSFAVSSKYVEAYKNIKHYSVPFYTGGGIPIHDFNEITFDSVSFKYRGSESFALENVNLTIRKGERLSIVGYNGSGKSTLIKLLCQIYRPTSGRILIDGVDINDLNHDDYMNMISALFQDFALLPLSIRDNVGMNFGASDTEIFDALEKSQLSEKIPSLSNGLDTEYSREYDPAGAEFSGGEKQKLASARTYCKNGSIVILDEPTSAYDPLSEDELYRRFDSIIGEKTAVYVTHRLASVKFCDKIAVFAGGKLSEYGTHKELMKSGGLYSEMYGKQSAYYKEV